MNPRVVLDTSVLLSAERHELIFLAHQQIFKMVWSSFLVAEVVRIRTEWGIKHQVDRARYRQGINDFVHELSRIAELVDYTLVEGAVTINGSKILMMNHFWQPPWSAVRILSSLGIHAIFRRAALLQESDTLRHPRFLQNFMRNILNNNSVRHFQKQSIIYHEVILNLRGTAD